MSNGTKIKEVKIGKYTFYRVLIGSDNEQDISNIYFELINSYINFSTINIKPIVKKDNVEVQQIAVTADFEEPLQNVLKLVTEYNVK